MKQYKKHRIDDFMETVKMLSDVYPNLPKSLDQCVFERTEWSLMGDKKQQRKALKWLMRE